MIGIADDLQIKMFRKILEIRQFEEALYDLFSKGTMPGTMHQYIGQEAVAVGACEALRKDDYIASTHRGHGHCIAKGAPLNNLMAEMFAKRTGVCKGMGGSMHMADFSVGMLGAIGIVGAGIPIAAGTALSSKLRKSDQVAVSFFGEGATNQGVFFETVNMADIWKLPVIFVCENNIYGVSTHVKKVVGVEHVKDRMKAFNIPSSIVDGMDVSAVYKTTAAAVIRARRGEGASFIECTTYRYMGHARFEPGLYRSKEEIEAWKKKDPIQRQKRLLIEKNILSKKEIENIEKDVAEDILKAIEFAGSSEEAEKDGGMKYVFHK